MLLVLGHTVRRYVCNHAGTDLFSSYCGKHRYYSVHGNICTYMSGGCMYVLSMYNKIKKIKLRRFSLRNLPRAQYRFGAKCEGTPVQSYLGFANFRYCRCGKQK